MEGTDAAMNGIGLMTEEGKIMSWIGRGSSRYCCKI